MRENNNSPEHNWWASVPGILTAVAGLTTAVTGLIIALNTTGILHVKPDDPITKKKEVLMKSVSAAAVTADSAVAGKQTTTMPFLMIRLVTADDLRNKTPEELRRMRNEIYARHGRIFKDVGLQNYFSAQSWYIPRYPQDQFPAELLTAVQLANVTFIMKWEDRSK
jgi:tryptophanase